MAISSARTLSVADYRPPGASYGVVLGRRPMWWPPKDPLETLDYSLDISPDLIDCGDRISQVSVRAAPSGTGALQIASPAIAGGVVTAVLSGGTGGVNYVVEFNVTTAIRGFHFLYHVFLAVAPPFSEAGEPGIDSYGTAVTATS
jgi:hypothetical protein